MTKPNRAMFDQVTVDTLIAAALRSKRKAAPGVDGVTRDSYALTLDANINRLCAAVHGGSYTAMPLLQVQARKRGGGTRTLQIPVHEDKILQRAVMNILSPVFEPRFLPCSYGSRPRRSAHDAVKVIRGLLQRWGGAWVLDADIREFFDHIDHATLMGMLATTTNDDQILDLVDQWLAVGVKSPGVGIAQGPVISPLLANIYLDEVIDQWFEAWRHEARCDAQLVRYIDDVVIALRPTKRNRSVVRRLRANLEKRLQQYGLDLHALKTRVAHVSATSGQTFDALGFTFRMRHATAGGCRRVFVETSEKSLANAIGELAAKLGRSLHLAVADRFERVVLPRIRGHVGYFDLPGNEAAIDCYLKTVAEVWYRSGTRTPDERHFRDYIDDIRLLRGMWRPADQPR